MQIGFFDSGVGGVSVLYEAMKLLPQEDFLYFADTKNVPYGIKPKEEVKKYIHEAVEFIAGKGVKALVIACNTATSVAIEELRKSFDFPIIGMEPAVKPAVEKNGNSNKRVLVFATNLTLKLDKFKNLVEKVDNEGIVDFLPMPELVEFAERFTFGGADVEECLKRKLDSYDIDKYGTLVLGCTHYIFFKSTLRKILPRDVDIIDGNEGTVKNLKRILERNGRIGEGNGKLSFYKSCETVSDQESLKSYLGLLELLKKIEAAEA